MSTANQTTVISTAAGHSLTVSSGVENLFLFLHSALRIQRKTILNFHIDFAWGAEYRYLSKR
jgi:hypothetical protein